MAAGTAAGAGAMVGTVARRPVVEASIRQGHPVVVVASIHLGHPVVEAGSTGRIINTARQGAYERVA